MCHGNDAAKSSIRPIGISMEFIFVRNRTDDDDLFTIIQYHLHSPDAQPLYPIHIVSVAQEL